MAQGRKIPKSTWKKFLKLLAENSASVTGVANQLGISPRSFYNHCYEDPEFAKKAQEIFDGIRTPFVEDVLFSLINQQNLGAVKYYLERRGGVRWNYELQLEAVRGPRLQRDRLKQINEQTYTINKRLSPRQIALKKMYEKIAREFPLEDEGTNEKSKKSNKH